jgi:hypothetical protein
MPLAHLTVLCVGFLESPDSLLRCFEATAQADDFCEVTPQPWNAKKKGNVTNPRTHAAVEDYTSRFLAHASLPDCNDLLCW